MYGMIHRAIREMVIDLSGATAWEAVETDSSIGPAELISAFVYDDIVTIGILQSAARVLDIPLSNLLEQFGRYWVKFAERGSYGSIMDFTGRDLPTFIANLDRMHHAVLTAMPEARVPSFSVSDVSHDGLRISYRSERSGLEPFVRGLLLGLMDRFHVQGEVEQVAPAGNAIDFLITYEGATK